MSKKALCVTKESLAPILQEPYINRKHRFIPAASMINWWRGLTMEDRTTCETDPSLLQIIPYIVVRHGNDVLCYSRGKAGDENRLHSKLSIGFGGHIDTPPPENHTLMQHICLEGIRELKEELGIDVHPSAIDIIGIVAEGETEVGQVHLGIYCICYQPADQPILVEKGVVEGLQTLSVSDICNKHYDRLEIWSQIVIDHLADQERYENSNQQLS